MTYCGISALSLLDRLPEPPTDTESKAQEPSGLPSLEGTIRWLVGRQTAYFPDEENQGEEEGDEEEDSATSSQEQLSDLEHERIAAKMASERFPDEVPYAGFSGRCNKSSDTCYSFWVGGALAVSPPLIRSSTFPLW
jgi:geranylgeranyl transferase type-1 subunit beta